MRKILKSLAIIFGFFGVALALGAAALTVLGMPEYDVVVPDVTADQSPQRVAEGRRLALMACHRCHYATIEHRLTGRAMTDVPGRLGVVNSPNITQDPTHGIGDWSAGEVAFALRTGIDPKTEQLMMPWMPRYPRMATEDLESIVAYLKSDSPAVQASALELSPPQSSLWAKFFAYTSWEPYAYPRQEIPRPDPGDPVLYGEYLVNAVLQCHACHTERLDDVHLVEARNTAGYLGGGAKMTAMVGEKFAAANITPHATGIKEWSLEDLRRALIDGFARDGTVLRWPMLRYQGLSQSEVEAIYAYLQTVTPIDKSRKRPEIRTVGPKLDAGLHAYQSYGCMFCHGATGRGVADLRGVDELFPTDAELIAFLRDPGKTFPGTPMPAWDGEIAEKDYPALCEITRRLSNEREDLLGEDDAKEE